MSRSEHYTRWVECSRHDGCRLWPVERCTATASTTGQRCSRRAAPGSLTCSTHGGPRWHEGISGLRRGDPQQVAHSRDGRWKAALSGELQPDAPLGVLTAWGGLGDSQIDAVLSELDGSEVDTLLAQIVRRG